MNLQSIGWTQKFSDQFQDFPGCTPGRVSLSQRGSFIVWTEAGEIEATTTGSLHARNGLWPVTGDWVVLRDGNTIDAVLNRRTSLERKRPGKTSKEQILAANLDVLFVVAGLDNDFNPRRLERYLILAKESGIRPVLVLNKTDVHEDPARMVKEAEGLASGIPVIALSAGTDTGIDQLNHFVSPSETAALAGSSGVGKSTIVNRLIGMEKQLTGGVRLHDSRGRHTTTSRELFMMPQGWLLMDMPGIRELQFARGVESIEDVFDDVQSAAEQCRFRDCSHQSEPGCSVQGNVPPERLEAFRNLQQEGAHAKRQADEGAALLEKQRWRAIHKAMRNNSKGR